MKNISNSVTSTIVMAVIFFFFCASPVNAYPYCFLPYVSASICMMPEPEDPKMEIRASIVDLSSIQFNIKSSSKDRKQCKKDKGKLGRLKSGEVLCVAVSTGSQNSLGDPVPGIDVSLEQIPNGIKTTTETDLKGKYIFDGLSPGTYVLRVNPQSMPAVNPKGKNYNSSRSNTSHKYGTEQYIVDFIMDSTTIATHDPGITIKIGRKGKGRISGIAIKEEGVKIRSNQLEKKL